jgi:cytochrome c oxidase subunit 2
MTRWALCRGIAGAVLAGAVPAHAGGLETLQPWLPGLLQANSLIMLACLALFVAVFAATFYSLFRHRRAAGSRAAHFHRSAWVEFVWTAIPFVILAGMAYPATKTVIDQQVAEAAQRGEQQVASR